MDDNYLEIMKKAQEVLSRDFMIPKTPDINLEMIESPLIEQNEILKKTLEVVTKSLELATEEKKEAKKESKRNLVIAVTSIAVAIIVAILGFIF
jgi:hypothetical protein